MCIRDRLAGLGVAGDHVDLLDDDLAGLGLDLQHLAPVSYTHLIISGCDKQQVGQFAAEVREKRPPEPYKGKGIKYTDEVIRRKAGKTGAKK